jgi:hypothetical protein
VPDQVWLGVGLYRTARYLITGTGSFASRVSSLGQFVRIDPILFLAFGLIFVAQPHLMRLRARIRFDNEVLDEGDLDAMLEDEDTVSLEKNLSEQIEASQAGNEVVLPATVLRPCRSCGKRDIAALNILLRCGHFPFCDDCVKSRDSCFVCESKGVKNEGDLHAVKMTSRELAKTPTTVNLTDMISITRSCAVCQEREGLLTLMPCGHLLFCGPCALGFRRCPFCSTNIVRAVRGFDVRHNEIVNT